MSLKINLGWRKILKWSAVAIGAVLFLVFFIRVATWEDAYYREMEGSERDVIESSTQTDVVAQQEELIEVEPTEEEVYEYTVAPDRPRYLTIPALNIYNSRILAMGINSEGALDTPRNIFDVGWYVSSGKPGEGKTMVIDGHNGGPHVYGVFKRLPDLGIGDAIIVERGDGITYNYVVVENKEIPLAQSDSYMSTAMKSPEKGKESITLISCSGDWSQQQGTYLSRQFVRAVIAS